MSMVILGSAWLTAFRSCLAPEEDAQSTFGRRPARRMPPSSSVKACLKDSSTPVFASSSMPSLVSSSRVYFWPTLM